MPCIKCSNGKYKYGERGNCQFDTLAACREAEQAIHAKPKPEPKKTKDIKQNNQV
jgi:hypothetical protein